MGIFLNEENFHLIIIIAGCFALSGYACSLFLTGSYPLSTKRTFFYLIFFIFIYQSSTLIALYSASPASFRNMIYIKIAAAFFEKTAFLLFIAFYIGKKYLKNIFLGIHIISVLFLIPFIASRDFRDRIVIFYSPFEPRYQAAAVLYAVISNGLYVFAAIVFLAAYKPFRQKKTSTLILYGILALNAVILAAITGGSGNVLRENTHTVIFIALLAFDLKAMPFLDRNKKFISHINILEGLPEAVAIYDNPGNNIYMHNGIKGLTTTDIIDAIGKNPVLQKHGTLDSEPGTFVIGRDRKFHLFYKVSPIISEGTVLGSIIVLRDITGTINLQGELEQKNKLLSQAFEVRKACVATSKKLASEEERAVVLDKVNQIAEEYISMVRENVDRLESDMASGTAVPADSVEQENEKLLDNTRQAISQIRNMVNRLYGDAASEKHAEGGVI